MLHSYVLSNGTLDEHKIIKRQYLYQGMNGRFVERFFINDSTSYIFKPLTNDDQVGKELWIHKQILKDFPPIYPRLLAHSVDTNKMENNWLIFEDLGSIHHVFDEEIVLKIVNYMARWHDYPTSIIKDRLLKGPKPLIGDMIKTVQKNRVKVEQIALDLNIPLTYIEAVMTRVDHSLFLNSNTLSHGDLHLGNFGYANQKVVVIDWEHVHINVPYWDIYHLLDSTHPVLRKWPNQAIREKALDLYMELQEIQGSDRNTFLNEYYLFASMFSFWMLLLIDQDLRSPIKKWSDRELKQQLDETKHVIKQCIEKIND